MKHAVCGILFRSAGGRIDVLMAHRSLDQMTYPECWDLPDGHVEAGERHADALIRELREELDVRPKCFTHMVTIPEPDPIRYGETSYHLYHVTEWLGEPRLIGDEHDELRWISPADASRLPQLALDDYRRVFARLED